LHRCPRVRRSPRPWRCRGLFRQSRPASLPQPPLRHARCHAGDRDCVLPSRRKYAGRCHSVATTFMRGSFRSTGLLRRRDIIRHSFALPRLLRDTRKRARDIAQACCCGVSRANHRVIRSHLGARPHQMEVLGLQCLGCPWASESCSPRTLLVCRRRR
jgi:hypothetical protein